MSQDTFSYCHKRRVIRTLSHSLKGMSEFSTKEEILKFVSYELDILALSDKQREAERLGQPQYELIKELMLLVGKRNSETSLVM